jgi:membrane-bound metal-dependent hydrolase YbcI (DUF457 family)
MKAVNHITFATSATLGASIYSGQVFFLPFIFFVALAALIPDIDHPKSELGKMLVLPAKILKHRGVTHSVLGVISFGGLLYLAQSYPTILRYILLVICYLGSLYLIKILSSFITSSLQLDPTKILQKRSKLLISLLTILIHGALLLSAFLIWNNRLYQEILLLTGIGYILHIIGDAVTKEGVPLFWPLKQKFELIYIFKRTKL